MTDEELLPIEVVRAGTKNLEDLIRLAARIEAEDHPDDPRVAERAPAAAARSLAQHDALASDSVWFLIAYTADRPAGLAILTRVPKLDARTGLLYLDELHVLAEYRRRGVGRALLAAAVDLADELGLAGIRLLTRPDNRPARALYDSFGFRGSETLLYQIRVEPRKPSF
jgi:ribosomal protein S18 acetylase RimI-like enzyme